MKILHNHLALIGALILLLIGIGCSRHTNETGLQPNQSTEKSSPQLVDVTEAKRMIAAKRVTILDVRTPDEFSAGHIAGAKNLNFYASEAKTTLQTGSTHKPARVWRSRPLNLNLLRFR